MDTAEIIRLMEAIKQNGISAMEWSEGNKRLRIERASEAVQWVQPVAAAAVPLHAAAGEAPSGASPVADAYKSVESPLVGIYHPVSDAKGVSIGARLKKGAVVCIVEAMKLMNEITMPEDGELVWLAAKDGDAVEFGQTLFQYK